MPRGSIALWSLSRFSMLCDTIYKLSAYSLWIISWSLVLHQAFCFLTISLKIILNKTGPSMQPCHTHLPMKNFSYPTIHCCASPVVTFILRKISQIAKCLLQINKGLHKLLAAASIDKLQLLQQMQVLSGRSIRSKLELGITEIFNCVILQFFK